MNPPELFQQPRWAPVVAVSVLVHAAVLGGALTLTPLSEGHRRFYAPVMTVNLVGPGPGLRPASPSPEKAEVASRPTDVAPPVEAKKEPPPKPKESPEVKATPAPKAKPAPEVITPAKVKPAPKALPLAKAKEVEPSKAQKPPPKEEVAGATSSEEAEVKAGLEQIRERLGKVRSEGGPGGPGGPRGGVSSVALDLRYRAYYNQIWQILEEAWVLPSSVLAETLQAVVSIGIDPAGKIVGVQFERRSGDRFFDESVERALAKVTLPPPPETSSSGLFQVGLRFTPRVR